MPRALISLIPIAVAVVLVLRPDLLGQQPPPVQLEQVYDQPDIRVIQGDVAVNVPVSPSLTTASVGTYFSNSIDASGNDPCSTNVKVALEASAGAIASVYLEPGAQWSYNRAMGDPAHIPDVEAYGVEGGCWCNLAARYAQVGELAGLVADFVDHNVGDMGAGPEYSVLIWNTNDPNHPDERDLFLANPTGNTVHLWFDWSSGRVVADVLVVTGYTGVPAPPGETSILRPPTMTAEQIDHVLEVYKSPAVGAGTAIYTLGVQYGIDPAIALAFFVHESTAGANPAWAGYKPDGSTTHNPGNISCAGYNACYKGFRDYPDWQSGFTAWFDLLQTYYVKDRGLYTLERILPVYAPASDGNDPVAYRNFVIRSIEEWSRS